MNPEEQTSYRITGGQELEFELPEAHELNELLSGYEVHELIARGGMGWIYRGYQPQLDRVVAIKVLRPGGDVAEEFGEHFQNEARVMARLHHTNIIGVHDFGTTPDGLLYIVMEYVEGSLLFDMIAEKRLERDGAIEVCVQVCDALQYAHSQGVVHRDIKPANILITPDWVVKIADFGLSKLFTTDGAAIGLGDEAYGTAEYVAPEVLDDNYPVDYRADIYSLGVMLYEMLTGGIPQGAFQPASVVARCDKRFDRIIATAIQPDPNARYQQATDFKAAVIAIREKPSRGAAIQRPGAVGGVAPPAGTESIRDRQMALAQMVQAQNRGNFAVWFLLILAIAGGVGAYFFVKEQEKKPRVIRVVKEVDDGKGGTKKVVEEKPKEPKKKLTPAEEAAMSVGDPDAASPDRQPAPVPEKKPEEGEPAPESGDTPEGDAAPADTDPAEVPDE